MTSEDRIGGDTSRPAAQAGRNLTSAGLDGLSRGLRSRLLAGRIHLTLAIHLVIQAQTVPASPVDRAGVARSWSWARSPRYVAAYRPLT